MKLDSTSNRTAGWIILLHFFCAIQTFAARPYHTDDPGLTEKGAFEIEVSADFWDNAATPGLVFKHGLSKQVEIDLPINYVALPFDERVVMPAALYLKFSFLPDRFAATFTGSFGDHDYAANLIYAWQPGPFTFTANCGSAIVGNTQEADFTWNGSCLWTWGRFETGAELGGTQKGPHWWQWGVCCTLCKWCTMDAGIGGDLLHKHEMNATTGLCFLLPFSAEE